MRSLRWKEIADGLGVQVDNVDLAAEPDRDAQSAIPELFERYGLLLFRGQVLSQDEQARFMSYFGPTIDPRLEPDSYITNQVGWRAPIQTVELCFHSDYAFFEEPPSALSLHAVDVVDDASSTRFSSGKRAYMSLPLDMRSLADEVEAVHVRPETVERRSHYGVVPSGIPSFARPLVLRNEPSGERYVYMSYMMIDHIVGLDGSQSEMLVDAVYRAFCEQVNIYEHRWRKGDLVVWNNLIFQHARGDTSGAGVRVLQKGYTMSSPTTPRYPAEIRERIERSVIGQEVNMYDDNGQPRAAQVG